ncbi:MAG: HAD family phosphatase [Bacteroidaceae bacterium]|nr:HAD family phosphatase [Bacteroidaceae bacterium]
MIKVIAFDFGGVIATLSPHRAAERLGALGLENPESHLDAFTQRGIFGDLECGRIGDEEFRKGLSELCGRELTWKQCQFVLLGYIQAVPGRNIDFLRQLRNDGYRVIILSNTNPFMMEWAMSPRFTPEGWSLNDIADEVYLSYKIGAMKPDPLIFTTVLSSEKVKPGDMLFLDDGQRNVESAAAMGIQTMLVENGSDWTLLLKNRLNL